MLYKIISLSLISCLCLQNNSVLQNKSFHKTDKNVYVETSNSPHYKLVASLPNKNIKLFGLSSQSNDIYDKFLLNVNGKTKIFNWKNVTSTTFSPKIILSDINNDNVEELIIILTTGTGSDLHVEDIHIINPNTLSEYTLIDPLVIIKEHVATKITNKDIEVLIQIKLNGNEFNIKKQKTYAGSWFEDVYFGNDIHWEVVNKKLYAHIGAQVSPAGYIGIITIEYKFENNAFKLSNISFKESI